MHLTSTRRRALVVVAAWATVIALPGVASAAYNDEKVACTSGTSGSVCVRLQTDSAVSLRRVRGSTAPNPGYGMYLRTVELHEYNNVNAPYYDIVVRSASGGNSMSPQAVYTADFRYGCFPYYGYMVYSTVAGTFGISTDLGARICSA
jgi:hypothetical protein